MTKFRGVGWARPQNALIISFCPDYRDQDVNSQFLSMRSVPFGWIVYESRGGGFLEENCFPNLSYHPWDGFRYILLNLGHIFMYLFLGHGLF